ncbi:hypothetical protein ABT246_24505 [Streptomyces sp. NPDC001553]|uniref:hypothetical protein n=1 Tax=Streptomyces sp. NPDC001553 TaxID=3154385 RepID=UPI00332BBF41
MNEPHNADTAKGDNATMRRVTTSAWNAFAKLYDADSGPLPYTFSPFEPTASGEVSNVEQALKYRVPGTEPAVVEELLDAGLIRAVARTKNFGGLLVDEERAALFDHVRDLMEKTGVRTITRKNLPDTWWRMCLYEQVIGPLRQHCDDEDWETTLHEVAGHINLTHPDVLELTRHVFEQKVLQMGREVSLNQIATTDYLKPA